MSEGVRVLIAGKNQEATEFLRLVLEDDGELAVVGQARTGMELPWLVGALQPQVVLLDIDSLGIDAVSAVRAARRSGRSEPLFAGLVGDLRSDGRLCDELDLVVSKDVAMEELLDTLRIAGTGGAIEPASRPFGEPSGWRSIPLADLPIPDLIRTQRELQERLALMQFWMEGQRSAVGVPPVDAPVVERPTVDGSYTVPVYTLSVDGFFSAQHRVTISGKEGPLHPHSWRVNVRLSRRSLGEEHVMMGFAEMKKALRNELVQYDGKLLNSLPFFAKLPPTSENVAAVIHQHLKEAAKELSARLESVTVWESPTNAVTYAETAP